MMWLKEKWERIKEIWLQIELQTEEEMGWSRVMLVLLVMLVIVVMLVMLGDDVSRLRNGE
jgi:hypothetical protein